jgi:hypothetical protein
MINKLILSKIAMQKLSWFQGPQLLDIVGGYKLYFSTREIESGGYYYSKIASIDLTDTFEARPETLSTSVIERGELGTYDHDGIFPLHVTRTLDGRILGFICGWKRKVSVDIDMSIGISESFDGGKTFQRLGQGPVLSSNLREPFLIGDPFVIPDKEGKYHMFYISGLEWVKSSEGTFERKYSIMHATSYNFIDWERDGIRIISDSLVNEAQAMPTVIENLGIYHMFYALRDVFNFRSKQGNGYRLAHAYSKSLYGPWVVSDWTLPEECIEEWNFQMQSYPHAIVKGQNLHLLYNGNEFGRDGIGMLVIPLEEMDYYARF